MKKILGLVVMVAAIIVGSTYAVTANACWFCSQNQSASDLQQIEQENVSTNQSKLETAVPLPQLENSLERSNISRRLSTFNDPAKVSYIYLINYGRVMAFYTIKGKITSGGKRLTSSQRQIDTQFSSPSTVVMESPELDGTYGSSAPYVYFWTTDGVYVQWSGDYMLVDQPLQLTSQPELIRNVK